MDFFQRYGAQRGPTPNVTYESRVRAGVLHRVMVWPGLRPAAHALCGEDVDGAPDGTLLTPTSCLICRGIERRNKKYRGD